MMQISSLKRQQTFKMSTTTTKKKGHSHRRVLLTARGDEQHAGGPGTAGVRVGVPGLGIAVVQEHQVQFSLVHRQLEEQRRTHAASRRLEVPLSADTVHGSLTTNGSAEVPRRTERIQGEHEIDRAAEERGAAQRQDRAFSFYLSIKHDTHKHLLRLLTTTVKR